MRKQKNEGEETFRHDKENEKESREESRMSCDQDLLTDLIDFVMLDNLISGQLLIRSTKHRIIGS